MQRKRLRRPITWMQLLLLTLLVVGELFVGVEVGEIMVDEVTMDKDGLATQMRVDVMRQHQPGMNVNVCSDMGELEMLYPGVICY